MAKFAIVTGSSTGIGLELAKIAGGEGYDLLLVADTPFTDVPAGAETLQADLSTFEGVDQLLQKAGGRQIDLLCDQSTNTTPQIEGKKVKAYAVTTTKRLTTPAL